jgi:hypothetical protein
VRITINVPDNDQEGLCLATVWASVYIGNGENPSDSFVISNQRRAALIEKKKNGNWSVKMEPKGVKSEQIENR